MSVPADPQTLREEVGDGDEEPHREEEREEEPDDPEERRLAREDDRSDLVADRGVRVPGSDDRRTSAAPAPRDVAHP